MKQVWLSWVKVCLSIFILVKRTFCCFPGEKTRILSTQVSGRLVQSVVKTDAKTIVKCKSFCGFITKRNDLPHFISFFMGSANSRAP